MFGELQEGSVIRFLSWISHKSRRPVKSTAAAEILAAGEAIDEIVVLRPAIESLYQVKVRTAVLADSKDLYGPLSSQRHPRDKSVRGDVNAIRYYYETAIELFSWIRGSCNPADVGTKLNCPLTDTFALSAATGLLHFNLVSLEIAS